MTIRELPTIEELKWNELALHPLQSYAWGVIREKTGVKVVRFGCFEDEQLKDVYQMTLHPVPHTSYAIGYIPRSRMPSSAFLNYLRDYSRRYKIICITFEPEAKEGVAVPAELTASAHPLFYKWTRVIDLSKSIEELKKDLEGRTRYNVGLAERKGVTVTEENTPDGFETFYTLFSVTTKRQHFGGHTKHYHETIWNIFSQQGVSHVLVARYEGRPLAACELFLFKNVLYYTYAGSLDEDRSVKAMNALMWGVIEFGKAHGAQSLDLWGIAPPDDSSSKSEWAGFSDFKKGYGGEAVPMCGSFDLVVFPLLYRLYVAGNALRKGISRLVG